MAATLEQDQLDDLMTEAELAAGLSEYYVVSPMRPPDNQNPWGSSGVVWLVCATEGVVATGSIHWFSWEGDLHSDRGIHILNPDGNYEGCQFLGGQRGDCDGSSLSGFQWMLVRGEEAKVWDTLRSMVRVELELREHHDGDGHDSEDRAAPSQV